MHDDKRASKPIAGAEQGKPFLQEVDAMTNHQIFNEIEQLFSDDNDNLDTEKLGTYLDVLQERDPVTEDFDSESLWEELIAKNPSLFEDPSENCDSRMNSAHPAGHHIRFRRWIGSIAAAAAMICMVTMVSNASFRTWVREAYEGSFVYRFFNNEETPDILPDYEITDLPDGYTLTESNCDEPTGVKLYEFEDLQLILMYFYIDDGTMDLIPYHDSNYRCSTVEFHGASVDFYFMNCVDIPNEMVWVDEQKEILFHLTGFFNFDEMLKMAESIS